MGRTCQDHESTSTAAGPACCRGRACPTLVGMIGNPGTASRPPTGYVGATLVVAPGGTTGGRKGRRTEVLEEEFHTYLADARGVGASHIAEGRTVVDGTLRRTKLSMVPGVEEFAPELQALRFGQADIFGQGQVKVVPARPVEEAATGIAELSQRLLGKRAVLK